LVFIVSSGNYENKEKYSTSLAQTWFYRVVAHNFNQYILRLPREIVYKSRQGRLVNPV